MITVKQKSSEIFRKKYAFNHFWEKQKGYESMRCK